MNKIRVLVVDDAVVVRRLVADVLADDPRIEVMGTAANGRAALERIALAEPDVVTLDLEMPEMDGLATLSALRQRYPRLPVIMLSRFTQRYAAATVEALALGASDYVPLPESDAGTTAAVLREQLLPRVRALAKSRSRSGETMLAPFSPRRAGSESGLRATARIDLLVIGSSTGGPKALATLLPALPANLPVPVAIVQHMPPGFTRQLAERLSVLSQRPVREAVSGAVLEPGPVWIAPGDYHITVEREGGALRLKTNQDPPENSCRPSVDVLVRSAAAACGAGTLAVILTGMGQDGLKGCTALKQTGGQVLVQDAASSVVWGMPRFVANAGLADRVLPLDQLAPEMVRRVHRHRSVWMAKE